MCSAAETGTQIIPVTAEAVWFPSIFLNRFSVNEGKMAYKKPFI